MVTVCHITFVMVDGKVEAQVLRSCKYSDEQNTRNLAIYLTLSWCLVEEPVVCGGGCTATAKPTKEQTCAFFFSTLTWWKLLIPGLSVFYEKKVVERYRWV